MNRRSFLKGSASVVALVAVAPVIPLPAVGEYSCNMDAFWNGFRWVSALEIIENDYDLPLFYYGINRRAKYRWVSAPPDLIWPVEKS